MDASNSIQPKIDGPYRHPSKDKVTSQPAVFGAYPYMDRLESSSERTWNMCSIVIIFLLGVDSFFTFRYFHFYRTRHISL